MNTFKINLILLIACCIYGGNSFAQVSSENFDVKIISGNHNFTKVWDDAGSGADRDVSVWRPKVPAGYFSLGDVVLSSHMADDRDSKLYTLVIRPKRGKEYLLKRPNGTKELWTDAGSGAHRDLKISSLNCPPGYNALGVIGNNLPNECHCVKDSETARGTWGSVSKKQNSGKPVAYWTDKGSGADRDVSFWRVSAGKVNGKNKLALSPNTFYSSDRHDKVPTDTPYALKLTFNNVNIFNPKDVNQPAQPKYLANGELPMNFPTTTKEYTIPFFLVTTDANYASQIEQMEKSPEYKVTRTSTYIVNTQSTLSSNGSNLSSTKTTGNSSQKDKSFSAGITTGLSVAVGAEAGVVLAKGSVEVTASVETSFSYSWGGSVGTYDEKSDTYSIDIKPNCKGVIFQRVDKYVVKNMRGEEVHSYSSNIPTFGQAIWCKDGNNNNGSTTINSSGKSTINSGSEIVPSKKYFSENKQYYMILQNDGNLVIYTNSGGFKWGSFNNLQVPLKAKKVIIQSDGNFVFYGDNNRYLWGLDRKISLKSGSNLSLSNSGELLLIGPNGEVLWNGSK